MTLVETVLLGLIFICALTILLAFVLMLLEYRDDPPGWWVRRQVPDFVPDDWTPSEARK